MKNVNYNVGLTHTILNCLVTTWHGLDIRLLNVNKHVEFIKGEVNKVLKS